MEKSLDAYNFIENERNDSAINALTDSYLQLESVGIRIFQI